MARLPRFNIVGQPQHVIQRGNNRQLVFKKKTDYEFYLEKLKDAADKHDCNIHAYVLMTNHVHILVTPNTENGISKMMQMVGRYYVQYFNTRYNRTGTLWEGRYKATLIDTVNYLLTCMRYIELNPVRAKNLVKRPADYYWSSYLCNALGKGNAIITPQLEYKRLGKTAVERQSAYKKLFRNMISEQTLILIRENTNKAWILGDDKFIKRIEKKVNRAGRSKGHGGDRKSDGYRST
ncbi:Transposase and inactivated derivatives [hydrothermal vent metagenome]|uniref:Transposase and inactivated derivatives n=1 Tax=hydrothermal vent metagenome TaxID=652676 RepID=A0A3B1ATB5_9ZZZZ